LTQEEVQRLAPDVIFLSSEPYPFAAKHVSGFREWLPASRIVLVDGEFFSWYGSRLLHKRDYLDELKSQLGILS
jgi:hypothetical protein